MSFGKYMMKIRSGFVPGLACLIILTVPRYSDAQRPKWLKELAESLPQYTIRASPISAKGDLSPDGKWLVTDYDLDAGIDPGPTIADRHAVRILERTGKVVQEVTRDNPRFMSVNGGVWGKDSNTLYFEYGSRLHPGNHDIVDGPEIWVADLGAHRGLPPCKVTSFTQLPIWSPRGNGYLIAEIERHNLRSNGESTRFGVSLLNTRSKTRLHFADANYPAWSPDGRWILLVNEVPTNAEQHQYLRIAASRSGKERALTTRTSSEAENRRYGWATATVEPLAVWLVDSKHLLVGVAGRRKGGGAFDGCFVISVNDGSRSFVPSMHPLSGSRNGGTILIERPDKKLFLLDMFPKRRSRK